MNIETIEDRLESIKDNTAIAYNVSKILQEIDFKTQKTEYITMLNSISENEENIELIDKLCIAKELYNIWKKKIYEDDYITYELTKSICSLFSLQVMFAEEKDFPLKERKMKIYWTNHENARELYNNVNGRPV